MMILAMLLMLAASDPPSAAPAPQQSGQARPISPEEMERLLRPPPQDDFAPELAMVPACMWRELDADAKRRLIERAEKVTAFAAVYYLQLTPDEHIDIFGPAKRCDPRWEHHFKGHYVAQQVGLIEGVALAILERDHIGRDAVERVWREDAELRPALKLNFVVDIAKGSQGIGRDQMHAAWLKLSHGPEKPLTADSPEAAAWSYWTARAWEEEMLEPLTRPRPA